MSGQLEAEFLAMSLGKVYTFGPTFRAENSNTTRHLSEFWMIEPEMAFADLKDDIELAEDFSVSYAEKFWKEEKRNFLFSKASTKRFLLTNLKKWLKHISPILLIQMR